MQDLHLVGFTKDHRHLIFSTRKDAKSGGYVVPVDEDLLEAVEEVVSHRARNHEDETGGPDEAPPSPPRVESQLSVREVQARLRAGDPAARIARDAGVDADWVERFAQPIRAEQRRVVDRALAVPLSRARAGESAVPLRRAIAAAMAERNVDFTAEGFEAAWSARLIGGNEWAVAFEFPNRGRTRVLEWEFDVASGTLTTSDRFASQLAFVEAAGNLPPAEATVGAEATRVGSQMSRGPLTSGGLARPGSGRVTEPSTSASSLPPVVRSADASFSASQGRSPRPTPPVSPVERPPAAPPRRPPAGREPEGRWSPSVEAPRRPPAGREPEGRRTQSVEPPRRPSAQSTSSPSAGPARSDALPRSATPPLVDRPRQPVSTELDRPTVAPVPPRRPAPVAAPTNATRSHTRRPVPEIAPRMPVVVDADEAAERRALIEDDSALRDVVPSHPPGGRGESVVILRAVDEPSDVDAELDVADDTDGERDDTAGADDHGDVEVDESVEIDEHEDEWLDHDEWVDDDDEWVDDDEWMDDELEEVEDVDADLEVVADEDLEDADDDDIGDELGDDDIGVDLEDEVEHDDATEEADLGDDDDEEHGADEVDDDGLSDRSLTATDQPADRTDDEARPAAASPRSRPRRLVARPELKAEPARSSDEPASTPRPRSSVQFRPGSATQAGSGRTDANPNGRDAAADAIEAPESAESAEAATEAPSRPRRRRRSEPLRAR